MSKQISRFGSYGIVVQDNKLLLTQKKSGPYCGLWGLPGGGIEFRESPEETLVREILEETAYHASGLKLVSSVAHNVAYRKNDTPVMFHQVGVLYQVAQISPAEGFVAEEKVRWGDLGNISDKELTPFAKSAIKLLKESVLSRHSATI